MIILTNEMSARRGVFAYILDPLLWLVIIFAIGIVLLVFLSRWLIPRFSAKKQKSDDDRELRFIHISQEVSDFKKVILYFLNLFLLQSKAKKNDKYAYQLLENKGPLNTSVYEYKILKSGQWQSRRISMGRIGEDSGARSKCFYVIYDDHFVVKIPPESITDFNEYIQSIKADRRIADILAPRECLVPRLSVVLRKVPAFAKFLKKSHGDEEKNCINGLKASPEYQDFLKIAGSFAFFMDLSKYFFLGEILNECHDTSGLIEKEFFKHQDLIWTPASFTDRYGEDAADLCFQLQNIFNQFDNQINTNTIQTFEKKAWFKDLLVGNPSVKQSRIIPRETVTVISEIRHQHANTINAFKTMLQKKGYEQSFNQNITRIQNICSRMIELLAWLYFKNIAIRDLKPDNMLIAGDPSKYPQFLSSAKDFELGLIDVEIAVFVGENNKATGKIIDQPKLGWTPYYATPAHMFINDVLSDLFDDTAYILKLQDWYAIVAMIYEAIIGEKLFVTTAALMASMAKELPLYFADANRMTGFAKKASIQFWKNSTEEFEMNLKKNESLLKTVNLEIFKNAGKMFKSAAEKSNNEFNRNQLISVKSKISAYELMQCMFFHIRETMLNDQWHQMAVAPQSPLSEGNAQPSDETQVL